MKNMKHLLALAVTMMMACSAMAQLNIQGTRYSFELNNDDWRYLRTFDMGDGNTTCLLPYPNDSDGRFPIKAGKDYLLFDKEADPTARTYRLTTGHKKEYNQLVIIYSPNAFTKCNIKSANSKQLGTIATKDFEKWLLTCQHSDKEMVVNRKTIRIQNANAEE